MDDIDNLELLVERFFLYDIGSSGYTEYDFDGEMIDFYEQNPECMEEGWKMGHLHSHHNMNSYFSGTDSQELVDSAEHHNFFLSIIVNARDEIVAKLVYKANLEQTVGFYAALKQYVTRKTKSEEVIGYHDCDVTLDIGDMATRITKISERKLEEERNKPKYNPPVYQNGLHGYSDRNWHQDENGRWVYDKEETKKKEEKSQLQIPYQIPSVKGVLNVEGFCAKVLLANLNYMGSFHQAVDEWTNIYNSTKKSTKDFLMDSLAVIDHLTQHLTGDQCDRLYSEAATKFEKSGNWFCKDLAVAIRTEFIVDERMLDNLTKKEFGTNNPSFNDDF